MNSLYAFFFSYNLPLFWSRFIYTCKDLILFVLFSVWLWLEKNSAYMYCFNHWKNDRWQRCASRCVVWTNSNLLHPLSGWDNWTGGRTILCKYVDGGKWDTITLSIFVNKALRTWRLIFNILYTINMCLLWKKIRRQIYKKKKIRITSNPTTQRKKTLLTCWCGTFLTFFFLCIYSIW